jgi:hypothetical protein
MRTATIRRLGRRALLIVLAGLLAGCTTHPAPPISDSDLQLSREFGLYTFYWVGRSFDGIDLTAADAKRDYDATVGMRVYYGNCAKSSSILSTSGCRLPLEIATVLYRPHSNVGLGPLRETVIRDAPAVVFNGGSSIEVYTGHLAIDINAENPRLARAAAEALVPLNRTGPHPRSLAPPKYIPGVDPRAATATAPARAPVARSARPRRG